MAELTVKGVDEVKRRLGLLANRMPAEIGRALYEVAQEEKTESMRRTPVDTGALRASHQVEAPVIEGKSISVTITVGGVAAPYAVYVHENLYATHHVGQAKFLESTILENARFLAERVAMRINVEALLT